MLQLPEHWDYEIVGTYHQALQEFMYIQFLRTFCRVGGTDLNQALTAMLYYDNPPVGLLVSFHKIWPVFKTALRTGLHCTTMEPKVTSLSPKGSSATSAYTSLDPLQGDPHTCVVLVDRGSR